MKNLFAAALYVPLLALGAGAAAAETRSFKSEFSISLYGLPLARTSFTTTVSGKKFKITGAVKSAGVGAIFDDTKGNIAVDGQVGGNGVRPGAYALTYVSGKRNKSTNIGFSGGSVVSTQNVPPVTAEGRMDCGSGGAAEGGERSFDGHGGARGQPCRGVQAHGAGV